MTAATEVAEARAISSPALTAVRSVAVAALAVTAAKHRGQMSVRVLRSPAAIRLDPHATVRAPSTATNMIGGPLGSGVRTARFANHPQGLPPPRGSTDAGLKAVQTVGPRVVADQALPAAGL